MTVCGSKRSWRRTLSVSLSMLMFVGPIVSVHANDGVEAASAQHGKNGRNTENRESAWVEFRDEMLRCGIEATITGFLVWFGNPPPQLNETPPVNPPDQNNTEPDPPPPPPPDPPTGGGEEPPIDPPFDPPPPNETPEPASLVTALLGLGLTSIYAWRRKRHG